jgi:hypothetical protein
MHRLTLPFSIRDFDQKQHDCRPPPTPLFSVSSIDDKTEELHFDTTEVIEAESQAVMNIRTEHDFQNAFKNGRSSENGAHGRSKVSFLNR